MVNGVRIEGPRELVHMDRIFIGAQEFLFIDTEQITDRTGGQSYVVCDSCGAISGAAKRHCGDCGRRLDPATGETSKDWSSVFAHESLWGEDTRPVRKLEVIGGIASKAIKMGRFDEAERVLLRGTGCPPPFVVPLVNRESPSGGKTQSYCGIHEKLTTCFAVRAFHDGQTCPSGRDDECPAGGLCRGLVTQGQKTEYACTYACVDVPECSTMAAKVNCAGFCGG
jgi:hypothetical protein